MRQYIQQKFITYGEINDHAMDYIMDTFINIIKVKKKKKSTCQSIK